MDRDLVKTCILIEIMTEPKENAQKYISPQQEQGKLQVRQEFPQVAEQALFTNQQRHYLLSRNPGRFLPIAMRRAPMLLNTSAATFSHVV